MKSYFVRNAFNIVFICFIAIGFPASAYPFTECTVEIEKVGVQDNDYVILYFENGGIAMLGPTQNSHHSLMLATTALIENRSIIVRYEDDNVECDAEYKKVTGIYIAK